MHAYITHARSFPKLTLIALLVLIVSGVFFSLYSYDFSLLAMFGLLAFYVLSAFNLKILAIVAISAKLRKPVQADVLTLFIGIFLQIIAYIGGFIALAEVPDPPY